MRCAEDMAECGVCRWTADDKAECGVRAVPLDEVWLMEVLIILAAEGELAVLWASAAATALRRLAAVSAAVRGDASSR